MRFATILGLAAILLPVIPAGRAQTPPAQVNPFYSADEYQRAHLLFTKLHADLNAAKFSTPAGLINRADADLTVLEKSWDLGVYDSSQMDQAVQDVEAAVDHSSRSMDRADLGDDASRLLDLKREYY